MYVYQNQSVTRMERGMAGARYLNVMIVAIAVLWSMMCIHVLGQATTLMGSSETTLTEGLASAEPTTATVTLLTAESSSAPEPESSSEPEAESTPESESEVTPGSEVTSEPNSDTTPDSEVTSEPESTATSEPESEATSEPESGATPESEVTSEPESESTSEPESESTSEPESESTSEPESEVTPESESTSEPESESTSEPEPELTSEPESESTSEPESESTSEPESESTSEPESESTSEPESEAASGAKSEVTQDAVSEASSPQSEVVTVPEGRPSAAEIVVPPVLLIAAVIIALLVLLVRSRRASINDTLYGVSRTFLDTMITKKRVACTPPPDDIKVIDLTEVDKETLKPAVPFIEEEPFFTDFDLEVLHSLRNCYNQPKDLVRIALPAVLSLSLCPLTLYLFEPFRKFAWPESEYPERPDINDSIACYLSPAGLVYATSFGFAFQQVLNKQLEILTKMTNEISMLDQIITFTIKLQLRLSTKLKILQAVKGECIFMVLQILNRSASSYKYKPHDDVKVKIWEVVDLLREVNTGKTNYVNRFLCERIMGHILKLNSICSDRMGILHSRIHPFKWVFLETLGFFSFLGILLLTAYSYRMELVMCIITVFSISMLCYVVSDLDAPFAGFFRVDIGVLEEVLRRLDILHEMAKRNGHISVFYPE